MQREFYAAPKARHGSHDVSKRAMRAQLPYRVGPSDVLQVTLTGLDDPTADTSVQARVNRSGDIRLPIVGAVKVGDMEIEDVEQAILDRYVPAVVVKNLTVHVEVVAPETTNVVVVGAVTQPGLVQLRRNESDLLHAVASAGGLSSDASGRVRLRRIRNPNEDVTLNLLDPRSLNAALSLKALQPGDILKVEAATPNTVFVGGLVNVVGPQAFPPGTRVNLLQLLAAAGGVREELGPTEATLIRRMPDGQDVHVKLDIGKLRRGEDPNITLAAGDIFWVPETVGTKIMDFISRSIFFRAGFSASYNVTGNATGIEFLNRRKSQTSQFNQGGNQNGSTLQNQLDPFGFLFPG
ncbi:MAG: polysaccharide biosynthesis/export family protein [Dehalococcoidia bacterium]